MPRFEASHNNMFNNCCICAFGSAQVVIQEGDDPVPANARFRYDLEADRFVMDSRTQAKQRLKGQRLVKTENVLTRGRFYEQIVAEYGRYVVAYVVALHGQKFLRDTDNGHALTAKHVQHFIVHLEDAKPLEPILKQLFQLDEATQGQDPVVEDDRMQNYYAILGMQARPRPLPDVDEEGVTQKLGELDLADDEKEKEQEVVEPSPEKAESMHTFLDVVRVAVRRENQKSRALDGSDSFPRMRTIFTSKEQIREFSPPFPDASDSESEEDFDSPKPKRGSLINVRLPFGRSKARVVSPLSLDDIEEDATPYVCGSSVISMNCGEPSSSPESIGRGAIEIEERLPQPPQAVGSQFRITNGVVQRFFRDDEMAEIQQKLNRAPRDLIGNRPSDQQLSKDQARRLRSLLETIRDRQD